MHNPKSIVSVIVPAKNEEKNIARCIESLLSQDYDNEVEIIIVDNYSTDNTYLIAKDTGVKVVQTDFSTAAAVRNFGASNAKGQILAFIDADCEAQESWLTLGVELLSQNISLAASGGPYSPPSNANWVVKAWCPPNQKQISSMHNALPGGNIVVHSDIFFKINGFNEALISAEDDDFCRRLRAAKYMVLYDQRLTVIHHGYPDSLKQVLKKSIWHGSSQLEAHGLFKDKALLLTLLWGGSILTMPMMVYGRFQFGFFLSCAVSLLSPALFSMARLKRTYLVYKIIYFFPSYLVCTVSLLGRVIGFAQELKRYSIAFFK